MAFAAVMLNLGGCKSDDAKKPATQVVARVNNGEITVYRLNSALGSAGPIDPQVLAQTKRALLDSLIDEELAVQAAERHKLERTPDVVQAIEESRRKVLARAWLARLATNLPKPHAIEVSRYYADHPELFAQRRVYNLQQLVVLAPDAALLGVLQQKAVANVPLTQIGRLLQERQVKYSAMDGMRPAERIPPDILAKLSKAEDGQTLLIEQPQSALIIHVVSSSLQPVDETAATPRIRQFLVNQEWRDAIDVEMKRLKQGASITYLGEFAAPVAAAATQPRAQATDAHLLATNANEPSDKGVPTP